MAEAAVILAVPVAPVPRAGHLAVGAAVAEPASTATHPVPVVQAAAAKFA